MRGQKNSAAEADTTNQLKNNKSVTQCQAIVAYIGERGSISSREAMLDLEIYRLGARIWELKKMGYPICGTFERSVNGKIYKRYTMKGDIKSESI